LTRKAPHTDHLKKLLQVGAIPQEAALFSRLHFGVLRKLEPFASNVKPYFLIEGIFEFLG
jgi:hypothetical protein